ncbi:hypothetical protein [Pacificibacter maritimus]|uniref:hypothetical protein n=1 Tax=Pacificibacter maritimus TaxID=762213 RepID=UPI000F4E967A|nr:hypothetical protein [Pacificibacter maritimus]
MNARSALLSWAAQAKVWTSNNPRIPSDMRSPAPFFAPIAPWGHMRAIAACLLCATTLACSAPPDVSQRTTPMDKNAPWPQLLSSRQLVQTFDQTAQTTGTTGAQTAQDQRAATSQRGANLRARAARMSGPVLDAATRSRLQAALRRAQARR